MSYRECLLPCSTSDHCRADFYVFTDSSTQTDANLSSTRLGWNNDDFDGISDYLATFNRLDLLTVNLTVDGIWSAFSDVLHEAIEMYVPRKIVKNCLTIKNRSWYLAASRHAITKKRCLWRKKDLIPITQFYLLLSHTTELKCQNL